MANKYTYLAVIQQNYGQGWEDVSEYKTNSKGAVEEYSDKRCSLGYRQSLLRLDLAEYKLMGYPTRIVKRKKLNT